MYRILFFIVGIIAILIIATLAYFGLFNNTTVTKVEMPSLTFVFKKHQGAYKKVGETMTALQKELQSAGISNQLVGIGIYLDNPNLKKDSELRSIVGYILSPPLTEQIKVLNVNGKFKIATIPNNLAFYAEFPFKGTLSYILAPSKVWPKFTNEVAQTSMVPSAGIEIYDIEMKKIKFYMSTELGDQPFEKIWTEAIKE